MIYQYSFNNHPRSMKIGKSTAIITMT